MKSFFIASLTFVFLSPIAFAQKAKLDQFKNWTPRNIGPSSMSGRITAIDAIVKDPNTIYVGSASGGVWKTTNGTMSWSPVFDEQPIQNIGSIAIQQSNPSVVWVGTGEGNPRNSLNLGEGIYKSLDGGKTWKRMGLEKTICIHRIVIDPTTPNTVYAASLGNPYGEHPDRGVFKTTDGGETWSKVLYVNDSTGCSDLVMDPSNPNKLIASMWQFRRKPWELKSGGAGSGLYITMDGGKNWKKMGKEEGFPDGPLGRIGVAISRSMPSRIYAKVEAAKNGFYRSDDGGLNWTLINSDPAQISDRPFYYQEIYVDPKNENRIYDIHSTVTISEDGGKTFSTNHFLPGIHVDNHAWWINPEDPNFMIDGNDGGMGITRDHGKTWAFDEKIPVGQFYHVNVDNEMPYHIMGGMQDNGSWHGPAYTYMFGGMRNTVWENVSGGDGFDVMPDATDPSWVYTMSQGGFLSKANWKTGESWFIRPPEIDPSVKFRFNWNAAMAQDPFDKNTIYYGSQFLHKSSSGGNSWQTISPDLTSNDTALITAYKNTGGLTMDVTGAETHCTILTIAPSPKEKGTIWIGTDDGIVQLTRDGGATWTSFNGKIPGLPNGCWIPQIRASSYNAGEVFVVANDYRQGDFKPYIFRSADYGKTWTRLVDEKKLNGYALCMIQDPVQPNLIFAGTERGLWVSLDNGNSFEQWKNGYPSVSTYDFAIQEREADLAIATFGRSLWVLDDIRPLRDLASRQGAAYTKVISLTSAPDAFQMQTKASPGFTNSTAGIWAGADRPMGARVTFFINKKALTNPPKKDTVLVKIYDENDQNIRNLRWGVDTGYNVMYWRMDQKGFRALGTPKTLLNAAEPFGGLVLSGKYKLVLSYEKNMDSAYITVNDDPRMGNRNAIKIAQKNMMDRLKTGSDKLNEGLDRLTDAETIANKMIAQYKGIEGKDADTIRKASNKMLDEIKAIREIVSGKISDKQGITRSGAEDAITGEYQQATGNIMRKMVAPGQQEEILVANVEKRVASTTDRINIFFADKWKSYRELVESTKLSLFKDYKPL